MGWFIYRAFKELRKEKAAGLAAPSASHDEVKEEALSR
jgi:hypothetical protein